MIIPPSLPCHFGEELKTFATVVNDEIIVNTEVYHFACLSEALTGLVVHLPEVQVELLDLFGDDCFCNCGVTQEKLEEFFTGLLLFENLSGQSLIVLSCDMSHASSVLMEFFFFAF